MRNSTPASVVDPSRPASGPRTVSRWFGALALVLLAACSTEATGSTTTTNPDAPAADPAAPARIVTPGQDVPNPFVLVEDGTYYLYATQEGWDKPNVPLRSGPSIDELGPPVEVLPELPTWARHAYTWAPDVRKVAEDRFVLWFTAGMRGGREDAPDASQCIGVAVASRPEGPFTPVGDEPQVCQLDRWGSIDPRTFVDDDGSLWLHWKSDDNAQSGAETKASIYAQRLTPDGTTLIGEATEILHADVEWEGRIVEAPHMIEVDGNHWLFYSGNWFNQPIYSISYALCEGPAGPCTKPRSDAWLTSNEQGEGPGESSMFDDEHGWWIVYAPAAIQYQVTTPRPVAMAAVEFGPDGPYLARR